MRPNAPTMNIHRALKTNAINFNFHFIYEFEDCNKWEWSIRIRNFIYTPQNSEIKKVKMCQTCSLDAEMENIQRIFIWRPLQK
jgi:hypothetical protein